MLGMLARIVLIAFVLLQLLGGDVRSEDERVAAMLSAPAGVFAIEEEEGHIKRLKIKGNVAVPTSMGSARGDLYARERAHRQAKAAFAQYLSEKVIFSESEEEGIILTIKDGHDTSETNIVSAKLYNSNASAMLNGLSVLLDRIEGEGDKRTCVVVLGWSQKMSGMAKAAKADMEAPLPPRTEAVAAKSDRGNADRGSNDAKPKGNSETITRVGDLDNF